MYLASMQRTAALTNVSHTTTTLASGPAHGIPSCKLPEHIVPNNVISAVHAHSITGVYVRVVLESFLLYLPGHWDGGGIQQYQS